MKPGQFGPSFGQPGLVKSCYPWVLVRVEIFPLFVGVGKANSVKKKPALKQHQPPPSLSLGNEIQAKTMFVKDVAEIKALKSKACAFNFVALDF